MSVTKSSAARDLSVLLGSLVVAFALCLAAVSCTGTGTRGGGGGGTDGNAQPPDDGGEPSDDQDGGGDGGSDGGTTVDFGVLLGTVSDTSGNRLAGVTVTAGTLTATSNEQGFFTIDSFPETSRLVVGFRKSDYVPTFDVVAVRIGDSTFVEAVMVPQEQVQGIDVATGGTVTTPDGGAVVIAGSSLVDSQGTPYTGTANVALTTLDPTSESDRNAFPGEFVGISQSGESVPMVSYGLMDITVRDPAGNVLGLASGGTAQIAIPIPASLVASAPDTMPLWYFREDDGQWHEEGVLTREGSVYRSSVTHFSIFNSDVGMERSYVNGRVLDCVTGQPIEGAYVKIIGISPRDCWQSGERATSALGLFRNPDDSYSALYDGIPVDADSECEIQASKDGVESEPIRFTSLPLGQILAIGDICLNVPRIRITLTWGAAPSDLDAHLTFPLPDGSRGHVFYEGTAAGTVLDTDDTDGNGPEIITIYGLNDGMYRYSVYHYRGGGTISESGASVSMIVDGIGVYNLAPPAGATGEGDIWRLWEITVQNGTVTNVNAKNEYLLAAGNDRDISVLKARR